MLSTPRAADILPGPEAAAEGRGPGVCFLRLLPPTSGLARRRRQRGAQLAGDISFHASHRRPWAWPEVGREEGRSWTGSPSGLAWRPYGGRGARGWTMSLLSSAHAASRRRLQASPGGGGGGAPCLGPEFAFLSFTHLPLDARPRYARSLVPTPSKTVNQIPPRPNGMEKAGAFTV